MEYSKLVNIYIELGKTSKRLEKRGIIADFLKKCSDGDLDYVVLLLQGRVFPNYDDRKLGINSRIIIKIEDILRP